MKKIIILFFLAIAIMMIFVINIKSKLSVANNYQERKNSEQNIISSDKGGVDSEQQFNDFDQVTDEKQDENILNSSEKEEEKQPTKENVIEDKKSNNNSTTEKKDEITKEEAKNESQTSVPDDKVKEEEQKETPIWEELGITEYEYYNSPMLSWQKVTHATFEECRMEGDMIINDENSGYTQYWCYQVNSYSGKMLGIMLKLS